MYHDRRSQFNVGALREARGPNPGRGPSGLCSSAERARAANSFLSFLKLRLFFQKQRLFSMPVAKPFVFVPPPWRGLARPAAPPRSSLPATKSPMAPTKRVSAHPQSSEASDSGDSELLGIDESRSVGSHEAGQAAATKRRKPCPEHIGDGAETRCFEVRLCEEEEPKPALDEATARDEAPNESLATDFVC